MDEKKICMTALKTISQYTADAWEVAKDNTEAAVWELMYAHGVCALAESLLEELKEETAAAIQPNDVQDKVTKVIHTAYETFCKCAHDYAGGCLGCPICPNPNEYEKAAEHCEEHFTNFVQKKLGEEG